MVREVVLVIVLGARIVLLRQHLRHHAPAVQRVDLSEHLARHRFLGRGVEIDPRAVLRAGVVALPVQRRRVVDDEEDLEDLAQRDRLRIEADPHHLVVAGIAPADLFVARVQCLAVAVAGLDRAHALHPLVHRLGAPEAATAQGDGFGSFVHGPASAVGGADCPVHRARSGAQGACAPRPSVVRRTGLHLCGRKGLAMDLGAPGRRVAETVDTGHSTAHADGQLPTPMRRSQLCAVTYIARGVPPMGNVALAPRLLRIVFSITPCQAACFLMCG